jgi:hypothetical protein
MNVNIDTTGLENIRIAMGADLIRHGSTEWASTIPSNIIGILVTDGADVPINDVFVNPNGTLEYLGRRILVYIRDQHAFNYKFHFVDCTTLKTMRQQNRYNRYVVTERTDGYFVVNRENERGEKIRREDKLGVCKCCLKEFNYQNYNNLTQREQSDKINKFNIEEFFNFCEQTGIMSSLLRPKYSDITAPIDEYPEDWEAISKERRRIKSYKCEECGLLLEQDKHLLQVHHVDHCRYNNSPDNLRVLCIRCHSHQTGPGHNRLRHKEEFAEFQKKYGNNNIFFNLI